MSAGRSSRALLRDLGSCDHLGAGVARGVLTESGGDGLGARDDRHRRKPAAADGMAEGQAVHCAVAIMSPYQEDNVRRSGDYTYDLNAPLDDMEVNLDLGEDAKAA